MPASLKQRYGLPLVLLTLIAVLGLVERVPTGRASHVAEWLQAGDVSVRAVRLGAGDTTLVLLHGYGESLMSWRAVADRLGQRFRVVAIDLPGFGLSDKPAAPYTLDAMQRRVADFIARWTEGPVVVVGHSMGGEIAAALAIDEPRVVAAVLVAPAGHALAALVDSLPASLAGIAGAATPLVIPVHDPQWLGEPEDRLRYDPILDPAYRAATRAVLEQFDFGALRDRFGELEKPVLVIWGRQDPTIPFEVGETIAAELPCATLVPIDGALHRPHQAQPDRVAGAIERFFHRSPSCES
ncbi:MAG TPA: alpha/beta fold hydrolase [Gemmatimonadales bacterium]|nr:alpha/beta fold hydrolase [Gemmatimonadales bacterium]